MNAVNRIELAIRRAASQMPDEIAPLFRLLAAEIEDITHDNLKDDLLAMSALQNYRREQKI